MENLESISVYELFPKEKDQNFYAIHTLIQLFNSDKKYLECYHVQNLDKTLDKMNSIRNHFSEFSINPYLILKNLNGNEKNILDELTYKIIPNFWKEKKLKKIIIKKINPSKNKKFMENLLFKINNGNEKEFEDASKAKELFCFYAGKEHISLIIGHLEFYSTQYNEHMDATDSLDD